jgi:hypothetical protein
MPRFAAAVAAAAVASLVGVAQARARHSKPRPLHPTAGGSGGGGVPNTRPIIGILTLPNDNPAYSQYRRWDKGGGRPVPLALLCAYEPVLYRRRAMGCFAHHTGAGGGLWVWAMAMVYGYGLWLWAMAMGYGCGLWLWAMAMGYDYGL